MDFLGDGLGFSVRRRFEHCTNHIVVDGVRVDFLGNGLGFRVRRCFEDVEITR